MKIENEKSYYETANLRAGKKLVKKYMKKAIAEVPKAIESGTLSIPRKSDVQVFQKFFHKKYIEAVYIYEKNGGWFGDILLDRGDETYVFGSANSRPLNNEQEAIDYVIHGMAKIIAVGIGKVKLVDTSDLPDGCIDFRLYKTTLFLPTDLVSEWTMLVETSKMVSGCTTDDVIELSKDLIHDEMSKPANLRNDEIILARVAVLTGCDVYVVNDPVGWDGDPFELPASY